MSMENECSAGRGAQRRRCLLDSGSGGIGKDVGFNQIERARTRAAQGNSPTQGLRPFASTTVIIPVPLLLMLYFPLKLVP